jgi:hypothetical protein
VPEAKATAQSAIAMVRLTSFGRKSVRFMLYDSRA